MALDERFSLNPKSSVPEPAGLWSSNGALSDQVAKSKLSAQRGVVMTWLGQRGKQFSMIAVSVVVAIAFSKIIEGGVKKMRADTLQREMQKGLRELKARLPIQVDDETTLVDLKLNGSTLTYVNVIDANINEETITKFTPEIIRAKCGTELVKLIDQGVFADFEYWNRNPESKLLGRITITSCKNLQKNPGHRAAEVELRSIA